MLISVVYINGKFGLVNSGSINELLLQKQLKSFLRSCGWVSVGKQRLRGSGGSYNGPERRAGALVS